MSPICIELDTPIINFMHALVHASNAWTDDVVKCAEVFLEGGYSPSEKVLFSATKAVYMLWTNVSSRTSLVQSCIVNKI